MVRRWLWVAVLVLAGCNGGIDTEDRAPYIWPTPPYGVPWTARSFTLRYNERSNSLEQIRAMIAERCGGKFETARVYPQRWTGTVLHPHSLRVACGDPPPRQPEFRGKTVETSTLMSLTRGGPGGEWFEGED